MGWHGSEERSLIKSRHSFLHCTGFFVTCSESLRAPVVILPHVVDSTPLWSGVQRKLRCLCSSCRAMWPVLSKVASSRDLVAATWTDKPFLQWRSRNPENGCSKYRYCASADPGRPILLLSQNPALALNSFICKRVWEACYASQTWSLDNYKCETWKYYTSRSTSDEELLLCPRLMWFSPGCPVQSDSKGQGFGFLKLCGMVLEFCLLAVIFCDRL